MRVLLLLFFAVIEHAIGAEPDLEAEDLRQLERDKILVTNLSYKQVFTPYVNSSTPVFITSDAVLSAFNVLFQKSVAELEERQCLLMEDFLTHIWTGLPRALECVNPEGELKVAAKRQSTLALGVALRICGLPTADLDDELKMLVDEEVRKIESATGIGRPVWKEGDPTYPRMDYGRFKPRGIYVGSKALERYFRCVVWLQTICFRVDPADELLTAAVIARALCDNSFNHYNEIPPQIQIFLDSWQGLLGHPDHLSVERLANMVDSVDEISTDGEDSFLLRLKQEVRKIIQARDVPINDMIDGDPGAATIRIWDGARLIDAALFQATTDRRMVPGRDFPTGLEVAATLGSKFAEEALVSAGEPQAVIDQVREAREKWSDAASYSVYDRYLRCLSRMVASADADTPDFMRSTAWQRKSCAALLGGWAQMRQTFVLQAKSNVLVLGIAPIEPGFVEPSPGFYRELCDLSLVALRIFVDAGAFEDRLEIDQVVDSLVLLRDTCRKIEAEPDLLGREEDFPAGVWSGFEWLSYLAPHWSLPADPGENAEASVVKTWAQALAECSQVYLEKLQGASSKEKAALMRSLSKGRFRETSMNSRWLDFIRLLSQIESLSLKQLRQEPFDEADRESISRIGERLAAAMLYDSTSYESPRDDAMKVSDVFASGRSHLHVGICRPRKMYVLYPWQGKEVLCVGVVTPYFEFTSMERLDKAAWKAMLDGPVVERPEVEDWYLPLLGTKGLWPE